MRPRAQVCRLASSMSIHSPSWALVPCRRMCVIASCLWEWIRWPEVRSEPFALSRENDRAPSEGPEPALLTGIPSGVVRGHI